MRNSDAFKKGELYLPGFTTKAGCDTSSFECWGVPYVGQGQKLGSLPITLTHLSSCNSKKLLPQSWNPQG